MNLTEVRNQRIALQAELTNYLTNPNENEREITVTRGRILRTYVREYNLENDPAIKARIQFLLRQEADNHKNQVNNRIRKVKTNKDISVVNQISNELGLKFRKLATNMRLAREGQTMTETAENMMYALGNTASIAGTALKAPVMATLRLSSLGIQYAAQLAVQPLHIPVYLFSKIINPEGHYQGKIVNGMGKFLGTELSALIRQIEKGVRRI